MTKKYGKLASDVFENSRPADVFAHLKTYDAKECPGGPADLTGMFLILIVFANF